MDIQKLSQCGKMRYFSNGEIVCMEGQVEYTAYLLLKGKVNVYVGSFNDTAQPIASIGTGSIFGEMSLLENLPRSATIVAAHNDTVALEIGKENFLQLMKTEPELAYNLLKTLTTRTEDSMNKYQGYMVAFNAEIRRNTMYSQIKSLKQYQFEDIIIKDGEYAVKMLKYLSHTLALIDQKVIEVNKKRNK